MVLSKRIVILGITMVFMGTSVIPSTGTGDVPPDLILHIVCPETVVETNVFTVTILVNETSVKDVIVILMDKNRKFEKII